MKIVIPGGTGQVGTLLARAFYKDGHEVVVLSRRKVGGLLWRVVPWDARTLGDWTRELEGADAIINLAGRNVNCRYTPRHRREIMESRIDSVRAVGQAIARATNPPRVWLQAATATLYAHRYDAANDDITGIIGGDEPGVPRAWKFSTDVAKAWEQGVRDVGPLPRTRTVILRSAMTMSPDEGGVFDVLLRLVRYGLGGRNGDGSQYVSWIHEADFVRALYHLIERESLTGPINIASPCPLPNAEFMRTLRDAWGAPLGLPAAKWMLEVGALFLRTETELILKSRRVVPRRLLDDGFRFQFAQWEEAAGNLCNRWRERRHGGKSVLTRTARLA